MAFTKIALMGSQRIADVQETLLALYSHLQEQGYSVVFELDTAQRLSLSSEYATADAQQLAQFCEILLVVGGDGSLLQAAQIAITQDLPVLGINRGRLGFLTDMYPHEFSKILQVLQGEYQEEQRFMLTVSICRQNTAVNAFQVLNEMVLSPGDISHMMEFGISIDHQFVCELHADGLIISTPTGSTAYALSGGGPIVHPALNAMVLVPMFPHTLSNRPLVVSADSVVTIHIDEKNITFPYISGDGQKRTSVTLGDRVEVKKESRPLRLIHPLDYNYFDTLRMKLGWQSKSPAYKSRC
ncbi:MAG: NAD(+) kinase [Gammaproteobacteria bacterium]